MKNDLEEKAKDMQNSTDPLTTSAEKVTQAKKSIKLVSVLSWIKKAKIINKHTCKAVISLMLVLWITNPRLIPFLPLSAKNKLLQITERLWGDVEAIKGILPISWVIIFQVIVMAIFLHLISEIFKAILNNIVFPNKRLQTFSTVLLSSMRYLFAIIGVIWTLRIMGINTTAIFTGISVLAAIVALCSDRLIADIVTGIFLIFDNQYNVGDIIDVGSFHGEVVKIGFRSTSLRDQGGNIKIINNSNMCDITNRSEERSRALCDITIPAKLDISAVEMNINSVLKTLKESETIFLETPEYWGIQLLKGQEMVIRIVAWVDERNVYRAQRLINRAVKMKLQDMKIWG